MGFLHAGQPADASLTFADTILTEDDIRDEKDSARDVVLIAREANILVHAFDLSVSDISTINVGKQIEHSHHANEPEVDLHTEADKQSAVGNFLTSNDRIKEYLPNDPLPFFPLKSLRQLDILGNQTRDLGVMRRNAVIATLMKAQGRPMGEEDVLAAWRRTAASTEGLFADLIREAVDGRTGEDPPRDWRP